MTSSFCFHVRNTSRMMSLILVVEFVMILVAALFLSPNSSHALALSQPPTNKQASSSPRRLDTKSQPWMYQGYSIYTEVTEPTLSSSSPSMIRPLLDLLFDGNNNKSNNNKNCSVVLIHGFGCSTFYWRETCRALCHAGYTVHAIDLLGLGKSDKPNNVVYSTELWSHLVTTYVNEKLSSSNSNEEKLIFIGNSLGSVVALSAAIARPEITKRVHGVGMYNCGVGMNSMNLLKDPNLNPAQIAFFGLVFQVLNTFIFGNIPLITFVLDKIVTKDLLQNALVNLYACATNPKERVDNDLVDSFYNPAKDAGSPQVLSQIYVNDAGPTPMELHQAINNNTGQHLLGNEIPIHLIWGNQDFVTPLTGYVGQYYTQFAADESSSVTMNVVNAGHIPFDEIPECNDSMVAWINKVVMMHK